MHQGNGIAWSTLPPWAGFFLNVGKSIQIQPRTGNRIVLGAALPTRYFASSLAAVGAVTTYLETCLDSDRESYFRYLCTLPTGTGVTLLRNDKTEGLRQYQGVLAGLTDVSVERTRKVKMLRIQISRSTMRENKAGGRVFLIDAGRAETIRVLDPDESVTAGELPATPHGMSINAVTEFARRVVRGSMAPYAAKSRVSCLIVGSPTLLRREINETVFGIADELGNVFTGRLNELLKVRRFGSSRRQFHSDIFAPASRWPPNKSTFGNPDLIIFDGATGFMKWRDSFPESHLVVLLDQAEPLFGEAVQRLNYEDSCRVGDEALPEDFPAPPPGIELTFFREEIACPA